MAGRTWLMCELLGPDIEGMKDITSWAIWRVGIKDIKQVWVGLVESPVHGLQRILAES